MNVASPLCYYKVSKRCHKQCSKPNLLQIEATRFAVKSLSSQWLSANLLPNLFATRQVTTDGINWCSWQRKKPSQSKPNMRFIYQKKERRNTHVRFNVNVRILEKAMYNSHQSKEKWIITQTTRNLTLSKTAITKWLSIILWLSAICQELPPHQL